MRNMQYEVIIYEVNGLQESRYSLSKLKGINHHLRSKGNFLSYINK